MGRLTQRETWGKRLRHQVVLGVAADGFAEAARLPWVSGGQRVWLPREMTGHGWARRGYALMRQPHKTEAIAMVFQELLITIWRRYRQDAFTKSKNSLQ
ncbi:MAG: hypothetical protein EA342_00195 [Leptolyngbya sp. LCM1.Bin17]|nr:MAG: hypothetical protein EA342_00195 [Leptolyngbya sp. LCM1.Bin17]